MINHWAEGLIECKYLGELEEFIEREGVDVSAIQMYPGSLWSVPVKAQTKEDYIKMMTLGSHLNIRHWKRIIF